MLAQVQLAIATHTENMKAAQEHQKFVQDTVHTEQTHQQNLRHQSEMAAVKKQTAAKGPTKT